MDRCEGRWHYVVKASVAMTGSTAEELEIFLGSVGVGNGDQQSVAPTDAPQFRPPLSGRGPSVGAAARHRASRGHSRSSQAIDT